MTKRERGNKNRDERRAERRDQEFCADMCGCKVVDITGPGSWGWPGEYDLISDADRMSSPRVKIGVGTPDARRFSRKLEQALDQADNRRRNQLAAATA